MNKRTEVLLSQPLSKHELVSMDLSKKHHLGEVIIQTLLFISAAISILTTIGIVIVLGRETINFFTSQMWEETNKKIVYQIDALQSSIRISDSGGSIYEGDAIRLEKEEMRIKKITGQTMLVHRGIRGTTPSQHPPNTEIYRGVKVSILDFFAGTQWIPRLGKFGIWPLLTATLMVSGIAMVVALPIGLSIAIYLSEYASERARGILKPILEVLAGNEVERVAGDELEQVLGLLSGVPIQFSARADGVL